VLRADGMLVAHIEIVKDGVARVAVRRGFAYSGGSDALTKITEEWFRGFERDMEKIVSESKQE
jgi:hypothetical protein